MIGTLIKSERINQNMKQKVLAKGICSPSYLCKIENNQTEPSEEVLKLLLKRLDLPIEVTNSNSLNYQGYLEELFTIYKDVVQKRTVSYTKEKLNYLQDHQSKYLSKQLFYNYKLIELYFLLILGKESKDIIDLLSKNEQSFDREQAYLYEKCMGIYYYNLNQFSEADYAFERAEGKISIETLGYNEKADLAYMRALVKLADSKFILSLETLEYAKKHFISSVNFSRLIECLIIEGIAQQKLKNLVKARYIFIQALNLTENLKQNTLLAVIYQNLGSVNSSLDNLEESLFYYTKSYEMKVSINKKLVTIFSIIQIYSKQEDYIAMEMWIDKGLSLIGNREIFQSHFYHFKMYYHLYIQLGDLKFINEALNYFENENDSRHVYKYAIKVAELLRKKQKYKLTTYYYERAILIKNKNYMYWEDL